MRIKYTDNKNNINIYSEAKVLSSEFKQWFFDRLVDEYDLYEIREGESAKLLTSGAISSNMNLSQEDISDLKVFYNFNKISDISFDELVDFNKFLYQSVYLIAKGTRFDFDNWETIKNKIAKIELEPDGSWNCLWLDIFVDSSIFIKLIDQYNQK